MSLQLFILIKLKASDVPSLSPIETIMLDYHPVKAKAMMTCSNVIDSKTLVEPVTHVRPS